MLTSAAAERFSPRYRLRMSSPTAPLFSGWNWTASTYIEKKDQRLAGANEAHLQQNLLNRRMSHDGSEANLGGDERIHGLESA